MYNKNSQAERLKEIDATLAAVRSYWATVPYLRLGQLVNNISGKQQTDPFYISDARLVEGIKKELWDEYL